MQRLEVRGAVRPIYGSLGVKRLITCQWKLYFVSLFYVQNKVGYDQCNVCASITCYYVFILLNVIIMNLHNNNNNNNNIY